MTPNQGFTVRSIWPGVPLGLCEKALMLTNSFNYCAESMISILTQQVIPASFDNARSYVLHTV